MYSSKAWGKIYYENLFWHAKPHHLDFSPNRKIFPPVEKLLLERITYVFFTCQVSHNERKTHDFSFTLLTQKKYENEAFYTWES